MELRSVDEKMGHDGSEQFAQDGSSSCWRRSTELGGAYRNQWSHLGRSLLPAGPPPISRCLGGEHRVGLSSGTAQEGPELWKKTQTWSSAVWIVEAATSCGSEFVAPICWACFSISTVRRLDCIISGSFHGMGSFNRYLMSIYRDHVCLTHLYMPCPWNSSWCIL